jgi:ferredoxin
VREKGERRIANLFLRFRKRSERQGWFGWLYNIGERYAPVTRSSPLRRCVQIACLGLFLFAFFYVCWPYSASFDQTTFTAREIYKAELFLLLDPLVGVSILLAGQYANWATFVWTIGILVACLLVPRGFCGYLCPLGTLIDLFDWLIGRHFRRFHLVKDVARGGWVHFKYYLLTAVLVSSLGGVLLSGFFAAIPVLTRGMMFTGARVQLAALKGERQLAPVDTTFYLSVTLFVAVFVLSLLGRRFWCRYVCPSGALLSVGNFLRIGERKVADSCIHCNRCIEICPFDAIKEDFTTRTGDCTYCQTCGGVCPPQAIQFVSRWHREDLKEENDPPVMGRPLSRRSFVAATAAAAVAAVTVRTVDGSAVSRNPLRPPGSVPEEEFLDLCIRCGQCFKVCPGPVLHPAGLDFGWEDLWTPVANLDHAGCHQDCNFCTLVCPTGAIQPLEIGVKRKVHMGLARVDVQTCLPFRAEDRRDCDLCYSECRQAGYDAIEMREIQIELDPPPPEGMFSDMELLEMSRIRAPFVDADACVGCGICQYRCFTTYVKQQEELEQSAIVVSAENQHRLMKFPAKAEGLPPSTDRPQ